MAAAAAVVDDDGGGGEWFIIHSRHHAYLVNLGTPSLIAASESRIESCCLLACLSTTRLPTVNRKRAQSN